MNLQRIQVGFPLPPSSSFELQFASKNPLVKQIAFNVF